MVDTALEDAAFGIWTTMLSAVVGLAFLAFLMRWRSSQVSIQGGADDSECRGPRSRLPALAATVIAGIGLVMTAYFAALWYNMRQQRLVFFRVLQAVARENEMARKACCPPSGKRSTPTGNEDHPQ
ncbi:MAG: hypothetical protein ACYSX0_22480 [Planctomycetota bacterium]|jgi:hypothetical protein